MLAAIKSPNRTKQEEEAERVKRAQVRRREEAAKKKADLLTDPNPWKTLFP